MVASALPYNEDHRRGTMATLSIEQTNKQQQTPIHAARWQNAIQHILGFIYAALRHVDAQKN